MTYATIPRAARRAAYVSEFTRFLDTYLEQHPEVVRDQQLGWRIWWERPVKTSELERMGRDEAPLPYHSYCYE